MEPSHTGSTPPMEPFRAYCHKIQHERKQKKTADSQSSPVRAIPLALTESVWQFLADGFKNGSNDKHDCKKSKRYPKANTRINSIIPLIADVFLEFVHFYPSHFCK